MPRLIIAGVVDPDTDVSLMLKLPDISHGLPHVVSEDVIAAILVYVEAEL